MATYTSVRRQRQAAATRQEILQAARRLFVERGYASTTMADIAAEAGVAVQTIYTSCGSKRELALALNDLIDDEAGVADLAPQLRAADDPKEVVSLAVILTRQIHERCGDLIAALISAAAVEPEAADVLAEGLGRHRRGTEAAARRVAKLRGLRDGVSARHAATTLAVLTSPLMWAQLQQHHGLSLDESQRWIEASLASLLLRDS